MKKFIATKRGFSLIELLVALSIIAIVAATIVPRFMNVRFQAAETMGDAQMKEFASAYQKFISLGGTGSANSGEVLNFLAQQPTAVGTARTTVGAMVDSSGAFGSTVISLSVTPISTTTTPTTATSTPGWYTSAATGGTAYFTSNGILWTVTTTVAGKVTVAKTCASGTLTTSSLSL
jgi:prepilin-type N-terminal cleavage/methylation domain-containing protein